MAEFVGGEEKLVNIGDPVDIVSKPKVYVVTADFYHESYGESIGLIGIFSTEDKADEAAKTVARELVCYDNVRYGLKLVDIESQIEEFVKNYICVVEVNMDEVHGMSQRSKDDFNIGKPCLWPDPDICLGEYIE